MRREVEPAQAQRFNGSWLRACTWIAQVPSFGYKEKPRLTTVFRVTRNLLRLADPDFAEVLERYV